MAFMHVVKILILPAAIAATIYALITYLILPLYRAHHARYSQYLPLDTLSERTHSARSRVQHTLTRWILPRHLQWRFEMQSGAYAGRRGSASDSDEGGLFEAEEGERMVGFDMSGRERLPVRRGDGFVAGEVEIDSDRRLSRELESGFRDESDDENGEGDDRRR